MKQDDDFIKFCRDNYHTPLYNEDEFAGDVKKVIILKKMFKRYANTGQLNERLVLNNIIILTNVFGIEASTRILFMKIDKRDWSALKTILLFTSAMPEVVRGIKGRDIFSSDISLDKNLVEILRKIVQRSPL